MSAARDAVSEYWLEAIECALDEHGVSATKEQTIAIARDIEASHECYGMTFHQPENPMISELSKLNRELIKERSKIGCSLCGGKGRITEYSGPWESTSTCPRCHGEGKHIP